MARKRKTPSRRRPLSTEEEWQKDDQAPAAESAFFGADPSLNEEESEKVTSYEQEEELGSEAEEEESEEDDESEEEDEEREEGDHNVEVNNKSEDKPEKDKRDRDSVRKLLAPFGKDQLIEFLKEAATRDRSILSRLSAAAASDPAHRKIFVHGLSWDTTVEAVSSVFQIYGPIEDCKVVADKTTGRCKGYGFILFKTRSGAQKALQEPQKKIGNRITSCQLASAGPAPTQAIPDSTGRKLFVTNIGPSVHPERLKAFFATFGEIEDGPLGYDPTTGKLRGYAIFVYKTAEGCRRALEEPNKTFEGCQLHCDRALERPRANNKQAAFAPGHIGSSLGPLMPNDLAFSLSSRPLLGQNAGLLGQGVNSGALLLSQNRGIGIASPLSVHAALNPASLSPHVAGGLSTANQNGTSLTVGYGGQLGIGPGVLGSYGSQVALPGLNAYQSMLLGQSSSASPASAGKPAGVGLIRGL